MVGIVGSNVGGFDGSAVGSVGARVGAAEVGAAVVGAIVVHAVYGVIITIHSGNSDKVIG